MSELFNTHSLEHKSILEDFQNGLHKFTFLDMNFFFNRLGECVSQIRSQLKYTENDAPWIILSVRLEPDRPVVQEKYFVSKLYDCLMEITNDHHSLLLPHPNDKYGQFYGGSLLENIKKLQQEISLREKKEGLLRVYSVENLKKQLDELPSIEEKMYVVRHFIVEMRQNVEVMEYIPLEIICAEELLHELRKPNPEFRNNRIPLSTEELKGLRNRFNGLQMAKVIDFFSVLLVKKNNSGDFWMTEFEFEKFIRRSFAKEDLDKPKINLGTRGKGAIVKLFHEFYSYCHTENILENRDRSPFIKLLEEAFNSERFLNMRPDNFKSDKTKSTYDWTN